MSADVSRQSGRLTWYVRHYAWLVVACVLALAAAPLLLGTGESRYQAETLVVAQQLTANQEVLPQLAESVFAGGAVESAVAADPAVEGGDLIPERLSVVTAEDSIAIVVQARDLDPTVAARLANLAAEAYVEELNRGGAGVGTFAVQAPAVVPAEPMSTMSPVLRAAAGALGGLILGCGLVALVRTIRRPVLDFQDVEEAAGAPLLGIVELPRARGHAFPGPRGVRGVAAVSRALAGVPAGRLLLVSTAADAGPRQRLFVMVATALRTVRGVGIEAPPEVAQAVERHALEDATSSPASPDLLLIDGGSPVDLFSPGMVNVSVVAAAPRGVPRRTLRRLVSEYVGNGLVGVILLDEQIGAGRAARPIRSPGSVSAPRLRSQKAEYVQEPGRA